MMIKKKDIDLMSRSQRVHFSQNVFQMIAIVLVSVKIIIIFMGCIYFDSW